MMDILILMMNIFYWSGPTGGYIAAYRQILATRGSLDMYFLKFLFVGAPRLGKTSMRRRLTGEIADISSAGEAEQPSTGTIESRQVIIRSLSSSTAVISAENWSSLQGLSDEARMLLQFFYETNSIVASEPSVDRSLLITPEGPPPQAMETQSRSDSASTSVGSTQSIIPVEDAEESEPPVEVESQQEESAYNGPADINFAFDMNDMLTKAMASKDWEVIKYTLKYTALIKMEDTGGQPEFMDMLPALVMGPSLYLIFCKLIDDLKSRYSISYLDPSTGESTIPVESTYTVEEMIFQALSAVACCRTCPDNTLGGDISDLNPAAKLVQPSSNSVAFIVATHKDMVRKEEIKKFDDELKSTITNTSFYKEGLVEFAEKDQLVLAVDNKTGGKEEVDSIRKFLQDRIRHHFKKIPIPAAWLMFSLCLRKQVLRMLSLEYCMELAWQFGMSPKETKVALWFLHHYAGVLMYFPDVPELEDTVICDVQIVFDSVTNMIVNTFKYGKVKRAAQEKFQKTGQFSFEDVKEALKEQETRDERLDFIPFKDIAAELYEHRHIWTKGKSAEEREEDFQYFEVKNLQDALAAIKKDHIPLLQLVKLLEHLNIIAPIVQSNPLQSSKVYLMPCVLENVSSEELSDSRKIDSNQLLPASLLIRYECGFVPLGVFPATIANLVGQSSHKLKLIEEGIKKNRVQFRFGADRDTITLISQPKYYEVSIKRETFAETPTHEVCHDIREIIERTLKTVTSRMNYAFSVSYQLSFECPSHPGRDHLCVVDSEETRPRIMDCLRNPDNRKPVKMQSQHLVWFGKVSKL